MFKSTIFIVQNSMRHGNTMTIRVWSDNSSYWVTCSECNYYFWMHLVKLVKCSQETSRIFLWSFLNLWRWTIVVTKHLCNEDLLTIGSNRKTFIVFFLYSLKPSFQNKLKMLKKCFLGAICIIITSTSSNVLHTMVCYP